MWNKQQDCRAEKELRYSIRKYKFGAASVAIAALMFLGAHVASADTINGKNQSTADLVKAKDESLQDGTDKPENVEESKETAENKVDVELNPVKHEKPTTTESLLKTADKSQLRTVLEELNGLLSTPLNLDSSLLSSIKDRVQRGQAILSSADAVQKDVDELASLLKSDVATLSQANKETNRPKEELANDKTEPTESEAKKKSDESSNKENEVPTNKNDSLKLSLEQLKAALLELPDHETTKEVLEKANDVISLAQGAVSNTGVTTSELEDLNKRVKRTFNSVKIATMRLNSGSHDPRNGQSIPRGIQFRAYTPISSSGALKNVKYYASVDPKDNGGRKTRNNEPEFTENKTVIKAVYEQNSSGKWMVYDIFFNNDGRAMVEQSYGQHYYFQPPFNIMDGSNRVENLTITRYRNVGGRRLSDGGSGFEKVGNTIVISNPWQQKDKIFDGDRRSLYDPNSGVSRSNQKPQVFKNNQDDSDLDKIVRKTDGNYTGGVSYTLGMEVGKVSTPYAIHMTARVKLKDNVTEKDAANGNVYAASVTSARNTNQSYIVGSLGTSLAPRDTTPPTINANGATVTKKEAITPIPVTAVDNTGGVGMRPNNPIEVTGLPQGLTFANGKITGTPTGPVGNSTVTIKAYDKNGNKAEKTITITVKDQASKYNPTGETLTVNQGQPITDDAVKAKVKNYASGSLTVVSKPSTAKPGNVGNAVVKVTYPDGSTENVNVPVTVLEAPDNQPPTLAISPANQTVVEGEKVTFTVTAKDNKVVTIDGKDFTTKYGTRLLSGKATNTNVKITDTEKVTTITITTTAEDVGKTNTITFNASDNAGNKAKPVTFTFNVTPRDTQKPEATLNGVRLTETANSPIFTVYRGATFNPELKVWDNSGVISKVTTGNLPYGITASTFTAQTGKTEKTPYTTRLSSGTVLNTQTLGDHIGTLHVEGSSATDSRDLKFKYRVVDIESKNLENGVAKVPVGSTLNVANSRKNIDSHNYLKVVDSEDKADRGNNYLPSGMTWTWKQGDKLEPGTTLDNSGKYTRNATAIFPTSVSDVNSTTRKTFAPTEIKRPVVLAVTPTAPSVVANENGTVTITPPTRPNSTTPQDIDTITLTYTPTGKTTPETVTVTKSGNNWTVNGKTTDKVSVTPAGVVTISDPEVADGKEVTAKVSKRIDNNLTLESPIAKEIAKGAKPQTPVVTAKDNGEVTAKPQDPAKVDKITVSYIGEDNQPQTAVGKKDPKGNWTVDKPEVRINPKTGEITIPENKVKDGTEVTVVTKNGNSADSDPAKAVAKDAIKPEATLNGVRLTENANTPVFTVYRGATFNPELKVWDNTGIISKVEVKEGLPKGVTSSTFTSQTGKTEANPYAIRLSSGTVLNTETLGVHESTLHVEGSSATDSRDFKFKYRVVDIETRNMENGIAKVPVGSTLNVANSGKNIDAHRYLKVVDSEDKADRGNNYLPSGMTWTWKQGDKLEPGTTLDNSGKYTRNATAIFPDTSKNSITDVNSTTRTTFAPVEIKRQVVLAVTPTVPSVVGNEDGSVTITPPTRPNSTTPQDIDAITITYTPTGKTNPETVTVTKSGNNWTVNGKSADKVSVTPAGVVTISDAEVADKTDITAKVSKKIDNNLTLESPVARGTANGPLAAEVTNPAPVPEKSPITPVIVVTPNKPGSSITTDKPVNGLTVDDEGKLKGTPTVDNWEPKEEERIVEIPVKVTNGGETVTVKVPVPIQRDTDGDGIPDKEDSDDDNDGIPDTEDANPKVADKLTGTVTGKTVPEKTPVPANTKVVTPNKPGTTITVDSPVNGLTVDNGGNLVGTPTVDNWEPKEEERTVEIPVKLKKGTEEVVVKVPVKIQRDTDGDGIPDVKDPDDDNDGIPDTEDANPKIADKLTGIVTETTVPEKTPVPANTKVITPNKPGTTITVDSPVNGLTVDNGGNLVGTPTVDNWEPKEEERTVEIPVKLKKGTEEVVVKVPVKIQRDTDGDGIPDVKDSDDDNDGIPDEEEITNGTDPKTPTTQTPTIEITQQPNGNA
ncbi:putative cell wall/surface protein, partial [Streptococcus mitis 13/39]